MEADIRGMISPRLDGRQLDRPIENPGQAWNALTVGACTHLTHIDAAKWPSLTALGTATLSSWLISGGGLDPAVHRVKERG